MKGAVALAIALVLAFLATPGIVQQAAGHEPILRTTVDPPRVVVGEKTTLRVEVLAPNYMTAPPAMPEFQIRNAVTRRLQNLNLSEPHDGMTYAGVRFEFAIYPQEPGSYAAADQKITVKFAAQPPQTREAMLSVPRIEFEAFIPDAAVGLDPFVAATRLTIEQSVQRSTDELKVGGSVTRTVTVKAESTPAMLLPPISFLPVEGLVVYPAQPSLQDHIDRRTDVLSASRVDAVTYMLEKPGDYLLPSIAVRWWNIGAGKIETAHLNTIELHVLDDPTATRTASDEIDVGLSWDPLVDFTTRHWPLIVFGIIAMAGFAWTLPPVARFTAAWCRDRRRQYLASESWSFCCLLATARHRNSGQLYSALLHWVGRFDPIAPNHTISAFKAAAQNPALDQQIDAVERELFARPGGSNRWSACKLLAALSTTRRRLLRQSSRIDETQPLPQRLNPVATHSLAKRHRPVAR